MSRSFSLVSLFLCASALGQASGEVSSLKTKEISLSDLTAQSLASKPAPVKMGFSPFTGKVTGDQVRLRMQPELDGAPILELEKNHLLSIVGQEGDFYAVSAPQEIKAYIFRSFVLDGVVEGNRVNIRLSPDLEAPILGHVNSGDRVEGVVAEENKKWLEISPPASCRFYVSKEFIEKVGDLGFIAKMESRKESVRQLLDSASLVAESEMEKEFEEINFDRIKQGFLAVINEYSDFPKRVTEAKTLLSSVQEGYLEKRIAYLEEKASLSAPRQAGATPTSRLLATGFHSWEPVEQALFASWQQLNEGKSKGQFYEEQQIVAVSISGVVEPYSSPVKNRPGDFIIKQKNLPVAYVYSTSLDLGQYVGKKVKLYGSPRPNNNFAFPAYYVHTVE